MAYEKEYNSLIERTIKAYIKHLGLRVKHGFLYKNGIAIYTEDLSDRISLFRFLEGISSVFDNPELWKTRKKLKEVV